MFKAQKCSKDIIKIVNVTSVVQPSFYEATIIKFGLKENKNNNFIQQPSMIPNHLEPNEGLTCLERLEGK